jgi:hypothetical protein
MASSGSGRIRLSAQPLATPPFGNPSANPIRLCYREQLRELIADLVRARVVGRTPQQEQRLGQRKRSTPATASVSPKSSKPKL